MYERGIRHVSRFGCFQELDQDLGRRVPVIVAAVARVRLLVRSTGFNTGLRIHKPESVAVRVTGFTNSGYPRHVASDATAESVDPMCVSVLARGMAALAQSVLKQPRFGHDDVQQRSPAHTD